MEALVKEGKFTEASELLEKMIQSGDVEIDDNLYPYDATYSKEKEAFIYRLLPICSKNDFFMIVCFLNANKLSLQPAVDRCIKFTLDELEPFDYFMTEHIIQLIETDPKKMSVWIGNNWDDLLTTMAEIRQESGNQFTFTIIKSLSKIHT